VSATLRQRVRIIIATMDQLFLSEKFDEAERYMFSLPLDTSSSEEIVAMMMVARWPMNNGDQDKFPRWREFIDKAAEEIRKRYPLEEANAIMRGLV
jgi:hypothetical protein